MAGHLPIYKNRENDKYLSNIEQDIIKDFNAGKIKETNFQDIKNIDKTKNYIALNQLMSYGDFIRYKDNPENDNEFIYTIEKEYDGILCPIEVHINEKENKILNIYLVM